MVGRGKVRLQLVWPNKAMRLLSHGDDSYQWVEPTDWRVSEVRLMHEAETVGDPKAGNLLIRGDATHALTSLTALPEYRDSYVGKVKLAYLDPPFNTGQAFRHYDDAVEHSVWLTMLRDRLAQIKKLLSPDGSVWVHLDDAEQHRARSVMDEVFGAENFVATVIWEKVYSPRMDAKQFSSSHDYVHVYSRQPGWRGNHFVVEPNLDQFPFTATDGRRYRSDPLRKWGTNSLRSDRPNLWYSIAAPDGTEVWPIKPDGTEGNWRWSKETYEQRAGEVDWLDKGNGLQPYVRQYADSSTTRPPETFWPHALVGHNHEAAEELKKLLSQKFSTPKPERLLERVLHIGSNPGDIVLDCFAGSGTTAAAAHKMGRRWVTVELSQENLDTFIKPRLTKVVEGKDPGGITESAGWTGGGGFRVVEVGPSMFEEEDDTVLLAEWAVGGELAEAVCAQLGYTPEHDGPFAGRKGRSRLAVLDGMLTPGVADYLVSHLGEKETLVVVAQSLDPDVSDHLRAQRPGSRARKVPRDLARIGRQQSQLVHLGRKGTVNDDE